MPVSWTMWDADSARAAVPQAGRPRRDRAKNKAQRQARKRAR